MHRLAELTAEQRSRIGWALLVLGTGALAVGVVVVHWAQFPEGEVVAYLNFMPRGWFPKAIGYLIALAGSQMMLAGAILAFVIGRPMTWMMATFVAFLAWIELVIVFGIVPSEWLNLAQTDLDWSPQRIAFTIPPFLVLGNEISISLAAVKDIISGTYNLVMLGAAAVFAYKVQDFGKPRAAAAVEAETRLSPYGRPLVKGGE